MVETARVSDGSIERTFTGVTKWGMTKVVGQRNCFGQVLVDPKCPRNAARNLRDLQTMGEARAVVIAFMKNENLRLVIQAAESRRMQYPVAIARIGSTEGIDFFGKPSSSARTNILGVGRKRAVRQRIRVCAAGYGSEFQSGPISWLVD